MKMHQAAIVSMLGAGHVVTYQSHAAILLLGLIVGMPIREALCSRNKAFRPIFQLLDDVYHTGVEMRVDVEGGVLWLVRLAEGVGIYYERSHALRPLGLRPEPSLPVLAE